MKLTQKQVNRLIEYDWEEDYEGTLKLINSFGIDLLVYDLAWFMEVHLPSEQRRLWKIDDDAWLKKQEKEKAENSNYSTVKTPVVGNKYHLAWAHRGCVWTLKEILPNGKVVLETPKTKKTLIGKTSDLLNVRGK